MSRFIDTLRQTLRGSTPSIGFRKATETEEPPLVIAVNLTGLGLKEAKQLDSKHIEAGVLGTRALEAATFEQWKDSLGDTPLGLLIEADSKVDVDVFMGLGCDFLVCGLKTPFESVNWEKSGKIVLVEPNLESGFARSLNNLPVDAVLVNTPEPLLTLEQVLVCYRFAALVSKPLLITIRAPLNREALEGLYQAGINGIFLDTGFPLGAIPDLKKVVKNLPRTPRKRPSAVPLLPRPTSVIEPEVEEEEEEG